MTNVKITIGEFRCFSVRGVKIQWNDDDPGLVCDSIYKYKCTLYSKIIIINRFQLSALKPKVNNHPTNNSERMQTKHWSGPITTFLKYSP